MARMARMALIVIVIFAMSVAGDEPVEILSLFGPQGERMHVRARSTKAS
jgi:hypothetical protein